jgi:hypothetical protein
MNKTKQNNVEKNKEIADFIKWFYEKCAHIKPDATHYASGHKILDSLVNIKDDITNVYTIQQIKKVCEELDKLGIYLDGLSILHYPNLLYSFSTGNIQAMTKIVQHLRNETNERGVGDKWTTNRVPNGW